MTATHSLRTNLHHPPTNGSNGADKLKEVKEKLHVTMGLIDKIKDLECSMSVLEASPVVYARFTYLPTSCSPTVTSTRAPIDDRHFCEELPYGNM